MRLLRIMRGQSSIEYVAGVAAAAMVLIVGFAGDPSPAEELLEALKGFWNHYSYLISMP